MARNGEPGKYEDYRPGPQDYAGSGFVQIATNELGVWLWRPADWPGRWFYQGEGLREVPQSVWSRFVDDPQEELRARRLIEDQERVRAMVADATKGKAEVGEEQAGYYLSTANGMSTIHGPGGAALYANPLPTPIAESIIAELVGNAEDDA